MTELLDGYAFIWDDFYDYGHFQTHQLSVFVNQLKSRKIPLTFDVLPIPSNNYDVYYEHSLIAQLVTLNNITSDELINKTQSNEMKRFKYHAFSAGGLNFDVYRFMNAMSKIENKHWNSTMIHYVFGTSFRAICAAIEMDKKVFAHKSDATDHYNRWKQYVDDIDCDQYLTHTKENMFACDA